MTVTSNPRCLALGILSRVENEGAYANLALRTALNQCDLGRKDRAFVTELVYGTTRMRRACDYLIDQFLDRKVEAKVRTLLRLGAYQLHWGGVPAHAAVDATVSEAPHRARGLCNAVLRKVANHQPSWPTAAVEHSYPDWIFDRLVDDLGFQDALEALVSMNRGARAVEREDGYRQDRVSQLVTELASENLETKTGLVLDLCAAPGGKATALAANGFDVVAGDISTNRVSLISDNAERLGYQFPLVIADGRFPPYRTGCFSGVLIDAPCSGLGVLRRRADARWRITPDALNRLAALQLELLNAAFDLVHKDGVIIYSVCTLTIQETIGVDKALRSLRNPRSIGPLPAPWRPHGRGGLVLPQDLNSEGMAVFIYRP